ncbi:IS256 family transposase, partial [Blastochloris sulfoviridis]
MSETTTVVRLRQPGEIDDPLTEVLRAGARQLLAQAIEAEVAAFLAGVKDEKLPDGRDRVVRHGHGPERMIQTGIGPVPVERAKVRDRADVPASEKIRFSSALLPKWARRTRSLDALRPILYLRGISTGDVQEVLAALLGTDAPNLSPSVVARLTADWEGEYERWRRRDLSARRYVYVWADGVYLQARMTEGAECMLVVIGATPEGRKELVGFQVGTRESAQSWRELLVDLKARGLVNAPELAVGDGYQHRTAWAGAGDGVLVYDTHGDGQITQANQVAFTLWDPTAASDIEALRDVFDTDHDGTLDADDANFAKFKVLVTNADGTQTLETLAELGIASIGLNENAASITLADGSSIDGTTTFTRTDGSTGEVATVTLATDAQGYKIERTVTRSADGSTTIDTKARAPDGSLANETITV